MAAPVPFRLGDAEWHAHRFVESDDAFRFIRVPRADHATMPFLTDANLGPRPAIADVPAEQCLALPGEGLHFLFHSAFCGSTMLVRALARPGVAMGLSEPVVLNDVVGFRRRGADPRAVARAADAATRLLARPFGPGEAVIVKPSNVINPLARSADYAAARAAYDDEIAMVVSWAGQVAASQGISLDLPNQVG